MIKLSNLRLPPGFTEKDLLAAAAQKLRVPQAHILQLVKHRQSLDARKNRPRCYTLTVLVHVRGEEAVQTGGDVQAHTPESYRFPTPAVQLTSRPVVVGSGPAGLFCALMLARSGLKPILIERGAPIGERARDVAAFFNAGVLNPNSNVQFGEGGAGTFSDGKLTTGTRDVRQRFVLEQFAQYGAPEEILYLAKPHIGTDMLRRVVEHMRNDIIRLGGDVRFHTRLIGISHEKGRVTGAQVLCDGVSHTLQTSHLILAAGHSARDTFFMLRESGVVLQQKEFAVGVRIEHHRRDIDVAQYGTTADFKALPAAEYKLAVHPEDSRSVYTFCMCPGGSVVGAASEPELAATNGMSNHARNGENSNSALLVNVGRTDFGGDDPLSGIAYQRGLERAAYRLGGGGYIAPAQLVGDFLQDKKSSGPGRILPTYRPGVAWQDLRLCLPEAVSHALKTALPLMERKLRGFCNPDAVLTAVESRSSSPVRIPRDENMHASLRGLYPCGEGAGYAGGIMSAAVDGIRVAEHVVSQ